MNVAQLVGGLDVEDLALVEAILAALAGAVPYRQMVEEIGLAIAVRRRTR